MNLPNKLTLIRIAMTFVLMAFLFQPGVAAKITAFVIFLLACFTDFLDGWFARTKNQITDFGKIMDPVADKVLVLGIFISFVQLQLVPAWMVIIIIIREMLVTGLRLAVVRRGDVIAAEKAGKHKTVSQMVTIFFILLFIILRESAVRFSFWSDEFQLRYQNMVILLMSVAVILTLYSGISFLWQNRKLIRSL
ncbi:MAG TPA: CDP-diacylglycerol--glycerol-3-phosphate 3-phosphatidyltransferase [Candidatus Omnitrophota bacterium]|nr:CDP-diacylglycerol--glycerol-3-phosphate 3-phosphatidyltransferase [Candidatus Omnitrophota bacterium]